MYVVQKEPKGIVTDIKKFATHDGPGIRTTVFIKGCFLRCKWCANPETQEPYPQLYFIPRKCSNCGRCVEMCSEQAISMDAKNKVDRRKCSLCMKCVDICPESAFKKIGTEVSLEEVVLEIEKDLPFYGADGGLTISGGEPLYQPDFTLALLKDIHQKGISTVLDTSGYAGSEILEEVVKYCDLVLLDLKHMDPAKHQEGTGVSNELILNNAVLIAKKCNLRISLPLIPGYNDSEANLRETAKFARSIGVEFIDIIPLHGLGASKYEYLGLKSPYADFSEATKEEIVKIKTLFNNYGLKITIGRMM